VLQAQNLRQLMSLIGADEQNPKSMFVGGCVRNLLLNLPIKDIDIATQYKPDEVVKRLEKENIKVIPTGIKHGTVTAVMEGCSFEITTLRFDDHTDGRHAEVSFTESWIDDAIRRDFTMNALYADIQGNIYDPTERGLADLQSRSVVFVGRAKNRITEDYLRILRFFRFCAEYGEGELNHEALQACQKFSDQISTLSRERITQEFVKVLQTPKAVSILASMLDHNVLNEIFDNDYRPEVLNNLVVLQAEHKQQDVMPRLFVVAGCQAKIFEDYLRLSHAQKNYLIKLDMIVKSINYNDPKALKRAIYYHGNNLLVQGYLLTLACSTDRCDQVLFDIVKNWQAPKFPLSGQDLMKEGYQTGPELGAELKLREEEWLESIIS